MAPDPTLCVRGGCEDGDTFDDDGNTTSGAIWTTLRRLNILCREIWVWNECDSASEVSIRGDDSRTAVTFHPHWSNGTAGIRASRPLIGALNYWEIHVGDRVFGTSLMFGVSTKKARLRSNEFKNLLGEDAHGWSLSHRGRIYHNGQSHYLCKPFPEYTSAIVGILVDRVTGHLTFYKDGECLGVAFRDLDLVQDDLYPTICSTAAKTAMMVGVRQRSFIDLQDRCRHSIVSTITSSCSREKRRDAVDSLPIPTGMKQFIASGL